MTWISVQFGAGGVSVERDFDVVPRVGDIVHVTRGDEDFDLLIDLAQHSEDPDTSKMKYFIHGHVIEDMGKEMERQMAQS